MKAQIQGSGNYSVCIYVRKANGRFQLANVYEVDSLLGAYAIEGEFLKVRHTIPMSSKYFFGGGFPCHSLLWLACHSCRIMIYDTAAKEKISEEVLPHPYLEKITSLVD